jgi:hypothetical protein
MSTAFWNRRITLLSIWGLLSLGAGYVFAFEPGKTGIFPPCVFRQLTGLQCPGCGSTRALHQLLHGHFVTAFTLNPLFVIATPLLLYVLLKYTTLSFRGITPKPNALPARYIYLIFVVIVSFWILRNTPLYPFVS